MIVPEYKFLLVLPSLSLTYVWGKYLEPDEQPNQNVRFGTYHSEKERTFRLDIQRGYFQPDSLHWTRQSMREHIKETFGNAKIDNLPAGNTIVMVWSNEEWWLNDRAVLEVMEQWNGDAKEPRSVWRRATSLGRWEG